MKTSTTGIVFGVMMFLASTGAVVSQLGCSRSKITVKCTLNHWPTCRRDHVGQMCHDTCTFENPDPLYHSSSRPIPSTPQPPANSQSKEKPKEASAVRYGFVTSWAGERPLIRSLLKDALGDGILTDDEYDYINKVHDEEDLAKAKAAAFDLLNSEMSIQVTGQ